MTSFASVTDFVVKFQQHSRDSKAHLNLNNLYSDALPNHQRLYVDEEAQTKVKDDKTLLKLIRDIIVKELIAPHARETTNGATDIAPLIEEAALWLEFGNTQRRLNKPNLTKALEAAVTTNRNSIEIRIGISHIYFDLRSGPINYLDWSLLSTSAFMGQSGPPPPAATASEIASAVASVIPPPMTATQLSDALASSIAAAFQTLQSPSSAPPFPSSMPPNPSTANSMYLFNPNALPSDVRTRYENKLKKGLILGNTIATPYSTGYMYHTEGMDKFFLSDGSLFLIQIPNEKGLMKATVYCEDDTHAGIRSWYSNFTQACHDYGYYTHPLWCFRQDHGGERGFTVGDDPTDDLPLRMQIPIEKMANPIFRLLSKKDMFPRNSRLPAIIRSCDGDGFRALKAVLFKSHPVFFDQPSTLITAYPKQRELSVLEYYKLFTDYEQLRAFIANVTATLDETTELDIFLRNMKYSNYINRVTRDERRLSSMAHKYKGSQLVETVEKYLMAPDSPALAESLSSYPKPTNTGNKFSSAFRKPLTARINNINHNPHEPNIDSDDSEPESNHYEDDITADLYNIKVPHNHSDKEIFHVYCASIHRITAQPKTATEQPCIVCNGQHRFDKCTVLSNIDFLRAHYVRYCQQLRRDAAARAHAFPGSTGEIPTRTINTRNTALHFVDSSGQASGSDSDNNPDMDFQRGRA